MTTITTIAVTKFYIRLGSKLTLLNCFSFTLVSSGSYLLMISTTWTTHTRSWWQDFASSPSSGRTPGRGSGWASHLAASHSETRPASRPVLFPSCWLSCKRRLCLFWDRWSGISYRTPDVWKHWSLGQYLMHSWIRSRDDKIQRVINYN